MQLALGGHHFDLSRRALVLGVLSAPPATPRSGIERDDLLRDATRLVAAGADALDVWVGRDAARVVEALEAAAGAVDVPLAVTAAPPGSTGDLAKARALEHIDGLPGRSRRPGSDGSDGG